MATRAASHVTTDHDEIRRWAEARGGAPACVKGTGGGGDVGMLRIDFPGFSGEESLQHIDWDEWFDKFDERGLALLYQETTAGGAQSNFNKLLSRETAEAAESGARRRRSTSQGRRSSGRTASSRGGSGTKSKSGSRGSGAGHRDGRTTSRSQSGSGTKSGKSRSASGSRSRTKSSSKASSRSSSNSRSKTSRAGGSRAKSRRSSSSSRSRSS